MLNNPSCIFSQFYDNNIQISAQPFYNSKQAISHIQVSRLTLQIFFYRTKRDCSLLDLNILADMDKNIRLVFIELFETF